MPHDMPQRPKQHRREELSSRVWQKALPEKWKYVASGQREYGIDGEVEIFDGDEATGLTFNVQLKGVDKPSATHVIIKTSTRNYWKKVDSPTLVVLVDASEAVHFAWAHNLDVYGRKIDAASYKFELSALWGDSSAEEIEREVWAARAARHLRTNLPVFWTLVTHEGLPTKWLGSFRASLERGLSTHRELTRRADQAGAARLEVRVEDDAVSVRLRGTPGGVLHYKQSVNSISAEAVAGDVMIGLAVEVERGGLDTPSVSLIETAIPTSEMLGKNEELTAYVATRVAEAGRGRMASDPETPSSA